MVRQPPCQLQALNLIAVFLTSGYHLTELFTPCLYITLNLTHPEQILSRNEITQMKIS